MGFGFRFKVSSRTLQVGSAFGDCEGTLRLILLTSMTGIWGRRLWGCRIQGLGANLVLKVERLRV